MQDGDVKLFNTVDGGEINVEAGLFLMDGGLESAAYLALFGGNEDDTGTSGDREQWWGNVDEPAPRTYRSETQHLLRSIPAISANLRRIEDAAKRDLNFFISERIANRLSVSVALTALNTIKLNVTIEAEGAESAFSFVENWGASTSSTDLFEPELDVPVSGLVGDLLLPNGGFFLLEDGRHLILEDTVL